MIATPMNGEQVHRWVVNEHRNLLSMIRGVESIVESSASPAVGDVARQLDELARQFASHAAREEQTPLYRDYPTAYPSHREALEGLLRDHATIGGELRELVGAVEVASSMELGTPIRTRIRAILAEIRRHEASEASIVLELTT